MPRAGGEVVGDVACLPPHPSSCLSVLQVAPHPIGIDPRDGEYGMSSLQTTTSEAEVMGTSRGVELLLACGDSVVPLLQAATAFTVTRTSREVDADVLGEPRTVFPVVYGTGELLVRSGLRCDDSFTAITGREVEAASIVALSTGEDGQRWARTAVEDRRKLALVNCLRANKRLRAKRPADRPIAKQVWIVR